MSANIKDKIKALLAKTTANGCTEAEAIAAAEMAAKLMRRHQLEYSDLEMTMAASSEVKRRVAWRQRLASAIATATNTAVIWVDRRDCTEIQFFGRDPGPQIALYLRDICIRAIKRAVADFRKSDFYRARRKRSTRDKAVSDFVEAMAFRLRSRIREIFTPIQDEASALVAARYRYEAFPDARPVREKQFNPRFGEAVHSGLAAGDKVPLNRGVAGEQKVTALL